MSEMADEKEAKCIILSVYSHKGGVGKTTIVDTIGNGIFNNSTGVRLNRSRVLMIDLDPQMNLTCKLLGSEEKFEEYINGLKPATDLHLNFTNQDIATKLTRLNNFEHRNNVYPNPIRVREDHNRFLDYIPGYPEMNQLIRQMTVELDQPDAALNHCRSITNLIQTYNNVFHYDLIILDLGPDLYTLNLCALLSSHYVLIPCTVDLYSCMSFRLICQQVFHSAHYGRFHSDLRVIGFLPNKVKTKNNEPVKAQEAGIDKLTTRFATHLRAHCVDQNVTSGAYIELYGSDLVGQETINLLDLRIVDPKKQQRVQQQLRLLLDWVNTVL